MSALPRISSPWPTYTRSHKRNFELRVWELYLHEISWWLEKHRIERTYPYVTSNLNMLLMNFFICQHCSILHDMKLKRYSYFLSQFCASPSKSPDGTKICSKNKIIHGVCELPGFFRMKDYAFFMVRLSVSPNQEEHDRQLTASSTKIRSRHQLSRLPK